MSTVAEVDRILEHTAEADDALREIVALVASLEGVDWAAVAFLERGRLTLGPASGTADEGRRARFPIAFHGDAVGELLVDGTQDAQLLQQIATRIAPYVLIGWDTGGEAWEP
jgi:hypothetical protein